MSFLPTMCHSESRCFPSNCTFADTDNTELVLMFEMLFMVSEPPLRSGYSLLHKLRNLSHPLIDECLLTCLKTSAPQLSHNSSSLDVFVRTVFKHVSRQCSLKTFVFAARFSPMLMWRSQQWDKQGLCLLSSSIYSFMSFSTPGNC